MEITTLTAIPVYEPTHVAEARRAAVTLARRLGFDETDAAKVALIVTEAAGNVVKHAGEGELVLSQLRNSNRTGIEILSLDRGPGMENPAACLRDGFSTAGTSGTGFGAIRRAASLFDVHSEVGVGTAVLAQLWLGEHTRGGALPVLEFGGISVQVPGETVCGDSWTLKSSPDVCRIMIVDGLGHGPGAAEASEYAVRAMDSVMKYEPAEAIQMLDGVLRPTRGASVAIADFHPNENTVRYAAVGNIEGVIVTNNDERHMISYAGTVGHQIRVLRQFEYPWQNGSLMVLNSDGLRHWSFSKYPGLMDRHPTLIAGVLYRDFRRRSDDATVVAIKDRRSMRP